MTRGKVLTAAAVVLVIAAAAAVWWASTADDRRAERAREARYRLCVDISRSVDETTACARFLDAPTP